VIDASDIRCLSVVQRVWYFSHIINVHCNYMYTVFSKAVPNSDFYYSTSYECSALCGGRVRIEMQILNKQLKLLWKEMYPSRRCTAVMIVLVTTVMLTVHNIIKCTHSSRGDIELARGLK